MGDTSIATDILNAVEETMRDDVGKTLTLRHFTEGSLTPGNPGAGRPQTPVNETCFGIISNFEEKRIDGTVVLKGDMEGVVSLTGLTVEPAPGMKLIDGTIQYEVIYANLPEVAGVKVVAILHLRR